MSLVKYNDPLFGPFYTKWPSIFDDEDGFFGNSSSKALSLEEDDDNYVAKAPVYGVDPKSVSVSVKGNLLTIKGEAEKSEEKKDKKGKKVVYSSSMQQSFFYQTSLPSDVKGKQAKAKVKNGVVTVTIPKAEEEKDQLVEIEVE